MKGYRILENLYKSERVSVFRAIRESDGKNVVIKSQNSEYPGLRDLTRIKYEYDLSTRFSLPGMVPILSLEKQGNGFSLVLEDVGGIPLLDFWKNSVGSISVFLNLGIGITQALSDLHKNGIIHKDIKPANILVQKETGRVYLIDLGLASLLQSEEQAPVMPDSLEGTLSYISPEQTGRMNRSIDFRTDLYSLGVTFYELLTSRLPLTGSDPAELVHAHIAVSPKPPVEINPSIPPSLSDMILKLLSKNAEDRYHTANGLLEDLLLARELLLNQKEINFIPGERESRGIFIIPQKLYGREAEVSFLLDAFERIASPVDRVPEEGDTEGYGGVKLVLVGGYSGVGKTALINEVHKPILEKRGYFLSGKFDQFKRNIPYYSLIQAFTGLIRQILTEKDERIQKWKQKILTACSPNLGLLTDLIPELVHIIGKQPEVPELPPWEAEERFQTTLQNFVKVFTSKDHPLVIFLDDLQWSDGATLKFLENIICKGKFQHLLLIGAYRDNEVDVLHPLTQMIHNLERENISTLKIILTPLMEYFIERMICDTLHREIESELSKVVHKKTGGNPFFIRQFLLTLNRDGIMYYTIDGKWNYDLNKISEKGYSENVVEVVAIRIRELKKETQEILKVASCIGASFSLSILAFSIEKDQRETAQLLKEALIEGIIIPESSVYRVAELLEEIELSPKENVSKITSYRFLHDRVQQAANSLLTEEENISYHVRIGKILYSSLNPAELEDSLFEITNHLNYGVKSPDLDLDYQMLIELNYKTGKKASLSNAIEPALNYFQISYNLLYLNKPKELDLELIFSIEYELGIALYLNGKFGEAELRFLNILSNFSEEDKIFKVQNMRIILYINQGEYDRSVELGLNTLNMYGIILNSNPTSKLIFSEYLKIKKKVAHLSKQDLLEREPTQNQNIINCLQILVNIYTAAYFTNINLCNLLILYLVELTITHGNSTFSGFALVTYANFCIGLGDYKQGYEYGLVALKLNDRFGNNGLRAKIIQYLTGFILHWNRPLTETLTLHEEGFQLAKNSGDHLYSAFFAWFLSANQDSMGHNLNKILQISKNYFDFANSIKYEDIGLGIIIIIKKTELLLGLNQSLSFNDLGYSEFEYLEKCKTSKMRVHLVYYYYTKARIAFLFYNYEEALSYCLEARKGDEFIIGMECSAELQFYQCISISSLIKTPVPGWKDDAFEKILKFFKKWSEFCPENFLDKYYLILAEQNRILKNDTEAIKYYNLSIEVAIEYNFIQNAGIAAELAAKYFLKIGVDKLFLSYIQDAIYYFQTWGAKAKVKDIEERYLLKLTLERKNLNHSTQDLISPIRNTKNISIDIQSILKATQAIAQEIRIESLLEKLLLITLENAGATRGLLLLYDNLNLKVEAEGLKENNQFKHFSELNSKDYTEIPQSLIQYSLRTSQNIILDSAIQDSQFGDNPYIQREKIKSLLCMQIFSKGKTIGLLYLENNLIKGAFTKDRIEILNLIVSQASISIENAKLYNSLEEKVVKRTNELQSQKKRLEQVQNFTRMIQNSQNLDSMIEKINNTFLENFGIGSYLFYLCNYQSRKLELIYSVTDKVFSEKVKNRLLEFSIPFDEVNSTHNAVMKHKKAVYFKNTRRGSLSKTESEIRNLLDISCLYVIPLINSGEVFAVISFADVSPEFQNEQNLHNLNRNQREDIELLCQSISSGLYQSLQKQELEKKSKYIENLNIFIKNLNESSDFDFVAEKIHNYIKTNYDIKHYSIGIVDQNEETARPIKISYPEDSSLKEIIYSTEIPIKTKLGAHSFAFKSSRPLYINNKKFNLSKTTPEEYNIINICKFKSILIIPLTLNKKNIGFLNLFNEPDEDLILNKDQINQLCILAEQLAGIIYSSNLYKEIQAQKQQLESTLSELRSTQAQLVEAEKSAALGQLISGVAHEINNPLAAIRSSAEILEMDQNTILEEIPGFFQKSSKETLDTFLELHKLSEKNRKSITSKEERQRKKNILYSLEKELFSSETIKENITELLSELWIEEAYSSLKEKYSEHELSQLLHYLSLFSIQKNSLRNIKLSTEKSARIIFSLRKYLKTDIRGTPRVVSLCELLEDSLRVYDNYLRGIVGVEMDINPNPSITCVVDEIQQVIKNIIFNAVQAMYASEKKIMKIKVDSMVKNERSFIRINFDDTGHGVPGEVVHKLFTPFFTTKSQGEGIGLGLYVSRKIVEEHGGILSYEPKDIGSRFTVEFPALS